jgi:HAD superfamily hydrolase (TIGR01458 family)
MTSVKGVLLDVDGVLVTSWRPLPGAIDTVKWLRRSDVPFRLVTNTTQFGRRSLSEVLSDGGLRVSPDEVLTATEATAGYLRRHHPGARCYLLATGQAASELGEIDVVGEEADQADVVVIGDAEQGFTYDTLNRAFRLLMNGAALVAMQRGLYWHTDEGPALDVGAFVVALEQAAGIRAAVAGKPSPEFFLTALESIGLSAQEVLMVGDDVQSDINAAREVGMQAALVKTGKFRPRDLELIELPTHVIESIADLPGLLQ